MISWITKSGVIYEGNEKATLPNDLYIRFYADGEFNFSIISTNMPSSVVIGPYLKESENIYAFKISGSIPSVLMDTTYSICCRLKQDNKIVDSVYSIDVKNVQVTWDKSIPVPPETIKFPVNTYNIYKLKLVNANGNEIALKSGVTKYNTDVSYATNKLDIVVETNSTSAKVEGFTNNKISYDFFDTTKEIKIKVISEAGDMTTYILEVNKREEKDATLKKLTIKNYKINFESGVFDYEISVLKNVDKLEIETTTTDSEAKVSIDGNDKLEFGENNIVITVENDGNIKNYNIKVIRLETDDASLANLKSLEIEKYSIDFKEDTYEYDLKIGDDNYLVITALPKVETSTVDVMGNLDLIDGSIIKIKVN